MLKKIVFAALLALTVSGGVCLADLPVPPWPDPSCVAVAIAK